MTRLVRSACFGASAFFLLAGTAEAQISHDSVKIGVLSDFQSNYSDVGGKGSLIAAQMAVDDFGGKVLGKSIELISAHHGNKPDIGSAIARRWYDEENVDMIIDVPNSSVALAVQFVAKEKGKLVIYTTAASELLTGKSCSPTGINWNYDSYAVGKCAKHRSMTCTPREATSASMGAWSITCI